MIHNWFASDSQLDHMFCFVQSRCTAGIGNICAIDVQLQGNHPNVDQQHRQPPSSDVKAIPPDTLFSCRGRTSSSAARQCTRQRPAYKNQAPLRKLQSLAEPGPMTRPTKERTKLGRAWALQRACQRPIPLPGRHILTAHRATSKPAAWEQSEMLLGKACAYSSVLPPRARFRARCD